MAERLQQLDDLQQMGTPENVAFLFEKIGYRASGQQLAIHELELD